MVRPRIYPNRRVTTTLCIDAELLKEARDKNINLSELLNRELTIVLERLFPKEHKPIEVADKHD